MYRDDKFTGVVKHRAHTQATKQRLRTAADSYMALVGLFGFLF